MPASSQPVITAAIYCRISLARTGDTTKVEDQERICRELCARRGWNVGAVYVDNNVSAWKRDRRRPGWDAMLADVDAGKLGAICTYHGDRLARQPWDLEQLINLAYGRGIKLASVAGDRDLSSEDDLFVLRIEVASQCRDSASASRRKKAQYTRMRRQGLTRPGGKGGRALCFEPDGVAHLPPAWCEIATRREVSEADLVREAAAAILGGRTPRSVLRELTARGLRSTAGNKMSQSAFQRTLLLPRMAGLMPDGESPAAWEPVLDRATWESLRLVVGGHVQVGRTGTAKHLLAGIARCGAPGCGHAMWAAYRTSGDPIYRCPPDGGCGKVRRRRELLDAYVIRRVVNRLAKPENPAGRVLPSPGLAAEFAALTEQQAEAEALLRDHASGRRAGLLLARLDSIDARLAELRGLASADAGERLRREHEGITEEELRALPLERQRALVAACFEITVRPASRRGPGFNTADVVLTPR